MGRGRGRGAQGGSVGGRHRVNLHGYEGPSLEDGSMAIGAEHGNEDEMNWGEQVVSYGDRDHGEDVFTSSGQGSDVFH